MYKIIIADDEIHISQGLQNIINWELMNIEIVDVVTDGKETYLSIQKNCPDFVLLDINMPNMSGLEVIELCASLPKPPLFLILSGYDNFSYVQKALQQGAVNYLLKPVNPDELINALDSCIKRANTLKLQTSVLQENQQILRNDLLYRILRNKVDMREFREKSQLLGISLHCTYMYVGGITILPNNRTNRLNFESIVEDCQQTCNKLCSAYTILDFYDNIIIIFKDQFHEFAEQDYLKILSDCSDILLNKYHLQAIYAVGTEANHRGMLPDSYNSCISKLEKMLIFQDTLNTLNISDIEAIPLLDQKQFIQQLENKNEEQAKQTLADYCHAVLSSNPDLQILKYFLVDFISHIFNCSQLPPYSDSEIEHLKWNAFSIVNDISSVTRIAEKLTHFFISLFDNVSIPIKRQNYSFLVQNAINYTDKNYSEFNLSLKTLAAELNVSSAYLGREFSKELGVPYNKYLNTLRINKAIHYLTTTTWSISQIATEVGFENSNYFFSLFKKETGLTPKDFRISYFKDSSL